MIVLGLNGFAGAEHDAAAALVVGGVVVAAVEEERLVRRRHAPGAEPRKSAAEVLAIAGVAAAEVDAVCHGWQPGALPDGVTPSSEADRIRGVLAAAGVVLRPDATILFVDHHVAHFWSGVAFLPPGPVRRTVDGLIIDGAGESTSGAYFRLRDGRLEKAWNLGLRGSLGLLYEAATVAVGMRAGDEGKTMGLASFAWPESATAVGAPPDDRFAGPVPKLGSRSEITAVHRSLVTCLRRAVPVTSSFNQRADLALGVQLTVQDRIMSLLAEADPPGALVIAGGVGLNCSINAVVSMFCQARRTSVTIPPPANDGGIAIGAAVAASTDPSACVAADAFLGRGFAVGEIADRLSALGADISETSPGMIAEELVAEERFYGWFEGRAEVGPRALGRRAIVATPSSARVRDRLNVLKGRETWRPLAPSIIADEFDDLFAGRRRGSC